MSYREYVEDMIEEGKNDRFNEQLARPGVEVWPDDEFALWIMRHSDPARSVICSTPEFANTPFCGVGVH